MSNVNTITALTNGTKRNQIPSFTISTTETAFSLTTDTGTTPLTIAVPLQNAILGSSNGIGVNGNASVLVPPGGYINSIPDGVNAPYYNSSSFDLGRPFNIRLIGTCANGAGGITTMYIYCGASSVVGTTGNRIATAAIPISTTGNFYLNVQVRWDATTAAVSGYYSGQVANATPIAVAALTNAVAAAAPANLTFVASAVGAAGATGSIQLAEFSLEQL